MVAFTLRVILIAETHVQREGEEVIGVGASVSRVIGDTFKDQTILDQWTYVQNYALVASQEHVAFVGGVGGHGEASREI